MKKHALISMLSLLLSGCTVTSITTPHDNSCSNGGCCGMICSQKPVQQDAPFEQSASVQLQSDDITVMVVPGLWADIKVHM